MDIFNSAKEFKGNSKDYKWRPKLYSQSQLELMSRYEERHSWRTKAFLYAKEKISEDGFPCPYSKNSIKHEKVWFCFSDLTKESGHPKLVQQLQEYVEIFKYSCPPYNLYFPLLVSIKTPDIINTLQKYNEFGWSVLQYLHDHDQDPWPENIPTDPENYLWSFSFASIQLFVNFSTPSHNKRKSRNFGNQLTLIINPRENFDLVAGNTQKGKEVRKTIRERIARYDEAPVCKYLGSYGVESNSEWRQYATSDDNDSTIFNSCPFKLREQRTQEFKKTC